MLKEIRPLETERLELRLTAEEDLNVTHAMRTDLENQRYIDRPIPMNTDATKQHLDMLIRGNADMRWYNWSIYLKKEGNMVGSIGLWNFSEDRSKAELGYELLPAMQRKGIMTEALRPVIAFGFDVLELECIDANTHVENLASIRLLEKYGFRMDSKHASEEGPDFRRFSLDRRDYDNTL